jgi:hypothetical protein
MANSGSVILNAVVTVNGSNISGTLNKTQITMKRPVVTWSAYGDESTSKNAGWRDEQVKFSGLYTGSTAEAYSVLFALYSGTAGGSNATLSICDGLSTSGTWTGTGKITELNGNLNMNEVSVIDCTIDINGTLAWVG